MHPTVLQEKKGFQVYRKFVFFLTDFYQLYYTVWRYNLTSLKLTKDLKQTKMDTILPLLLKTWKWFSSSFSVLSTFSSLQVHWILRTTQRKHVNITKYVYFYACRWPSLLKIVLHDSTHFYLNGFIRDFNIFMLHEVAMVLWGTNTRTVCSPFIIKGVGITTTMVTWLSEDCLQVVYRLMLMHEHVWMSSLQTVWILGARKLTGFNMFDQVWNEHYIIAQAVCDINNKILTRH